MASTQQSPTTPPPTQPDQSDQPSEAQPQRMVYFVRPARRSWIRAMNEIYVVLPNQRPSPTHVWGFIIPHKYKVALARQWGEKTGEYSEEELEEYSTDDAITLPAGLAAPAHIRKKMPDLPEPYPGDMLVGADCILPLADNRTNSTMNVAIPLDTIKQLRKELGLPEDAMPKWYEVTIYS